jgi:effector-binding domain-containing protein
LGVGPEVELKEMEAQPVVIARTETTPDQIGPTYGELIAEVSASLAKRSIPVAGPPFGRYFDYSKDHVDMAVGFPVAASVEDDGRVVAGELPGGRVAIVTHVGPYTQLGAAYRAIEAWIAEHGEASAGPPWEVYVTGPAQTADSSTWRTDIVQPIT